MGLSEPPLRPSRRPSRLKNPPSVTAARVGFGPRAPSQLSAKRWADGNNMQPRTLVFVLVSAPFRATATETPIATANLRSC